MMKKKRRFAIILFVTIAFFCTTMPSRNTAATNKEVSFTIIHTNDTHSHLENMPRLFTVINNIRSHHKNTLLLDAGDVFIGTLYFSQFKGLASIPFMNKLQYDAMTLGNHEFDLKSSVLANFIQHADFPFVNSNIDLSADQNLQPFIMQNISSDPRPGSIYPAIIKNVENEKVGIFGLTTEETPFISNPNPQIIFEDAIKSAKKMVDQLEHLGVNKIILLSHLGFEEDQELARSVKGIDIIVGGHSHTKLEEPIVIYNDLEPVLIVQADENGKYAGELSVRFKEDGTLKDWDGQLVNIYARNKQGEYLYKEDPWAKSILKKMDQKLADLLEETVGYSLITLIGSRKDIRTEETNLGNLIADSMLNKANELLPTHLAFQNSGGIRASIPEGNITMREVVSVLPFANTLAIVDLTGAELKEILEHSVSDLSGSTGRFLQAAGIHFTYNPRSPEGKRILSISIKKGNVFVPVNSKEKYTAAVNSFLARGGEGYEIFKRKKEKNEIIETPYLDFEILAEFLGKQSPAAPMKEGRIQKVFTNEPRR